MPLLHSIPTQYCGTFLQFPVGWTAEDDSECVGVQTENQLSSLDVILW